MPQIASSSVTDRESNDVLERIEWKLEQIRHSTDVIAWCLMFLAGAAFIAGVVAVLSLLS